MPDPSRPSRQPLQPDLFEAFDPPASPWPEGFQYQPGFVSEAEAAALVDLIGRLPLAAARHKAYTARRRVVSFGVEVDADPRQAAPAAALPAGVHALRERVAAWAGLPPERLVHTLVAEYAPGTPLGWHRDVPQFEDVFGVSLGGNATLRFRPWPPDGARRQDVLRVDAAPRSLYRLSGPARWAWQHSVSPVAALRWSITYRTLRTPGARR